MAKNKQGQVVFEDVSTHHFFTVEYLDKEWEGDKLLLLEDATGTEVILAVTQWVLQMQRLRRGGRQAGTSVDHIKAICVEVPDEQEERCNG